jgi:hypothetical protein
MVTMRKMLPYMPGWDVYREGMVIFFVLKFLQRHIYSKDYGYLDASIIYNHLYLNTPVN